jgi:hypothetical protein
LDFSEAVRYDPYWDLKERLVFDQLEDELAAGVNRLAHLWHCSAAQITGMDDGEEFFEFHRRKAHKTYNVIGKLMLPWYRQWSKSEGRTLAQLWKRFKDQMKDPAYAAHIRKEQVELDRLAAGHRDKAENRKLRSEDIRKLEREREAVGRRRKEKGRHARNRKTAR